MDFSIYEALKFAGARIAHHESDLYVKVDKVARRILHEALLDGRLPKKPDLFYAEDGSGLWYELPFAYDPFWDKRLSRTVSA